MELLLFPMAADGWVRTVAVGMESEDNRRGTPPCGVGGP